ncbi:MAG: hypothetical protein WAU68_14025 [Vitreimonas sp.]
MTTPKDLGRIPKDRMKGIPEHLQQAHEAAFYFHDRMVAAIREVDALGPRTFKFTVKKKAEIPVEQLMALDGISFARAIGESDNAQRLLVGECVLALTADALNYICESLFNYEKGKIGVSLSLLRKPLKENLLHLEWILADDSDFFAAFSSENRRRLNIDSITPERRCEIIQAALQKVQHSAFEDADFLYRVRYDKGFNGLEPLWQKAQHLITTRHASVLTEVENFNFIFATPDNIRGIYEHVSALYLMLIVHFYDVASATLQRTYSRHAGAQDYDEMCKAAALGLAVGGVEALEETFGEAARLCSDNLACSCGAKLDITAATFARALFANEFRCGTCTNPHSIDLYETMGFAKRV